MVFRWPIEIDDFPMKKWVDLSMAMLVKTRWVWVKLQTQYPTGVPSCSIYTQKDAIDVPRSATWGAAREHRWAYFCANKWASKQVNKCTMVSISLYIYIYVYTRICIYPSSPNALLEGVWTPKTKLTYSLRRCLEQDMHTDIENILPSGNLTVCYWRWL